jgi:hypothetical protein
MKALQDAAARQAVIRYGERPTEYFVIYADEAARARAAQELVSGNEAVVDPDHYHVYRDAQTLAEAQRLAEAARARGTHVRIVRRVDVRDITPDEDPIKAQLWSFEERQVGA